MRRLGSDAKEAVDKPTPEHVHVGVGVVRFDRITALRDIVVVNVARGQPRPARSTETPAPEAAAVAAEIGHPAPQLWLTKYSSCGRIIGILNCFAPAGWLGRMQASGWTEVGGKAVNLVAFLNWYGKERRYHAVLEICVYALALAAVAALGAANLYYPFGPDQAVVFDGAKRIDQGAIYYVDYWDNKQPGLYRFYVLAGRLFGFSELGIHLLELIYLLAFAVAAMVTLRSAFTLPWLSAFVPVATIGLYYGIATEFELTQLEFLVAFPLFVFVVCLLAAHHRLHAMASLYFLSGLLAAVAVLFKLVLAPLCVGLWLVAMANHFKERGVGLVALGLRAVLPAILAVVLVLGSVVLLYARWGHLDALIWTSFVYPAKALTLVMPASKTRLITALAYFISAFAPWLIFALSAVVIWAWRRRDLLGALMLTWLVVGVALFLVQRFSWWQYHTLLVLFPAGFLAVAGVDRLCVRLSEVHGLPAVRASLLAGLLAVTASSPLADDFLHKAQPLISSITITNKGVRYYQSLPKFSSFYANCLRAAHLMQSPEAVPGPIYVFGSAMIYEFSGRTSPHPTNGWSWEFYLPEQIDDVLMTLDRQQVPYIYVGREDRYAGGNALWVFRHRPKIAGFLRKHYVVAHDQPGGTGSGGTNRHTHCRNSAELPLRWRAPSARMQSRWLIAQEYFEKVAGAMPGNARWGLTFNVSRKLLSSRQCHT